MRRTLLLAPLAVLLAAGAAGAASAPRPYPLKVQPPGKFGVTATISCFRVAPSTRHLARVGGTWRIVMNSDWDRPSPDVAAASSTLGREACVGMAAILLDGPPPSGGRLAYWEVKTPETRKLSGSISVSARFLRTDGLSYFEHGLPTRADLDGKISDFHISGVVSAAAARPLCASRFGALNAWPSSGGKWFGKGPPPMNPSAVLGATIDLNCGRETRRAALLARLLRLYTGTTPPPPPPPPPPPTSFDLFVDATHNHGMGVTNLCFPISTTPAQASTSGTATMTGPSGAGTRQFTTDASGKATPVFRIDSFGQYNVSVTLGSKTVTKSHTVGSAQGNTSACPAP